VLIPSTALHSDKPDEKATVIPPTGAQGIEESIDSESAANLFKDDELIPISSGAWDDGDDSTDDAADLGGTNRATKPPGKRASRTPPNPARGGK
jgi:hypothetical protein